MAEEIFMDVPAVKEMAKKFGDMSEKLQTVSKGMEHTLTVLKASAFVGLFGNFALANYLEQIKPVVDGFADKCSQMSDDVLKSAEAYERGDAAGAAKFH